MIVDIKCEDGSNRLSEFNVKINDFDLENYFSYENPQKGPTLELTVKTPLKGVETTFYVNINLHTYIYDYVFSRSKGIP